MILIYNTYSITLRVIMKKITLYLTDSEYRAFKEENRALLSKVTARYTKQERLAHLVITEMLDDGPAHVRDVENYAGWLGVRRSCLRRVRDGMGVVSSRDGEGNIIWDYAD